MLTNAFIGRTETPAEADLIAVLGAAHPVWVRLLSDLERAHGPLTLEWKSYSAKHGWALRVLRKKRTVVWLSPAQGAFIAGFILGEKAMQAARATKLPARLVRVLETAPKYPEGTGVRLEVKSPREVPALLTLAAIKLAH
jgi:hypothetical protein